MRTIYFLIALGGLLIGLVLFVNVDKAHAGGPWSEQYCDVEITQIRVIDQQGNVVDNFTEEKVVGKDGASDFLFDMGIAESCGMYTWDMPVGEVIITQRQIACKKMDGTGYEIVQGYHGID